MPGGSPQWSVLYGYSANQIEFYASDPPVRPGTAISINDTNWHHIVYRKSAAGTSAWNKFVDGVKTPINSSINFTLGTMSRFYAFNVENLAPCYCSMSDIVIYDTARPRRGDRGISRWQSSGRQSGTGVVLATFGEVFGGE